MRYELQKVKLILAMYLVLQVFGKKARNILFKLPLTRLIPSKLNLMGVNQRLQVVQMLLLVMLSPRVKTPLIH